MSVSNNLIEKWKTDLFQDNALNKLFDQNISPEDFVYIVLRDYNIVQVGDIFSKLTAINHNIHGQMDTYIKKNCDEILDDIKENQSNHNEEPIAESVQDGMKAIKLQQDKLNHQFLWHYRTIQRLQPLLVNSVQALSVCKELQKFTQQMKILRSLAQATGGNQFNVVDPLKVAHILSDINKLPQELRNISIYKKQEKYLQQVQESVAAKVDRKFMDALNTKNFPEISGSLSIYYALGQLPTAIEMKANELLKTQMNAYKQQFTKEHQQFLNIQSQSKYFHSELRLLVKEDFNYALQIFLLNQALTQRDPHDFVAYEEILAPGNLFDQFWTKMCHIVQSSISIVIDNKQKFEVTYKIIVAGFPKIMELYQEYMFNFNEQLLLFPAALLTNFSIPDYFEKFLNVFSDLKQLYINNYRDTLTISIKSFMNEVATVGTNNAQLYQDRCLSAQINLVDVIRQEFTENIKLNPQLYKQMTSITISNLTRMFTTIQSKQSSDWPIELQTQITTSFPSLIVELKKIILDHKLNTNIDFAALEQLLKINIKLINSVTSQQYDGTQRVNEDDNLSNVSKDQITDSLQQ